MKTVTIKGTSRWLRDIAGQSVQRMRDEGMPIQTINSAGRTYAQQRNLFLANYTRSYTQYKPGFVDRRWYQGVPYYRRVGGVGVAVPGSIYSNHEDGMAMDVNTSSPMHRWLLSNGRRHGWVRDVAGEPWHWRYIQRYDTELDTRDWFDMASKSDLDDVVKSRTDPLRTAIEARPTNAETRTIIRQELRDYPTNDEVLALAEKAANRALSAYDPPTKKETRIIVRQEVEEAITKPRALDKWVPERFKELFGSDLVGQTPSIWQLLQRLPLIDFSTRKKEGE